MTDRILCCIKGCGRTFKREPEDVGGVTTMCGRHWRMGDEAMRRHHKQLLKRVRWFQRKWRHRQNAIERSGRGDRFHNLWYLASVAANDAFQRVWDDVQIKAAFGAEDAPRRRPKVDA